MNTLQLPPLYSQENRKWLLFSLIFSLFYFLPPLLFDGSISTVHWLAMIAAYLVFIAMTIYTGSSQTEQAPYRIAALLTLCFFTSAITPGTNALFGFSMYFAAYYLPRKQSLAALALTIVLIITAFFIWQRHPLFIGIAIFLSIGLFTLSTMLRKEFIHTLKERRSTEDIQKLATIAERERISRDLHDLLGHSLSGIALKAELAEKLLAAKNYEQAQAQIHSVAQLTRQALSEVRESVVGLKKRGLMGELETLRQLLTSAGFDTNIDAENVNINAIYPQQESALIMIVKEAGTNILRHSKGDKVRVTLSGGSKDFVLQVWDNGASNTRREGNGISGMRERCNALHGALQVAHTEHGTTITATLPTAQNAGESHD